jgi:hypothetical protein
MPRLDSKIRAYTVCAETPDPDSKNQLHIASEPTPLLDNNYPWDTASGVSNSPDSSILSDIRFDLQMFRSDNNSPPDNSRWTSQSSIPEHYVLNYNPTGLGIVGLNHIRPGQDLAGGLI